MAFVILAGGNAETRENLSADLFLRYLSIEVHCDYFITPYGTLRDDRGRSAVPPSNLALGLGLR